jgi:molecular chaperone GrpE
MSRLFRHPSGPSGEDSEIQTTADEVEISGKDMNSVSPDPLAELQAELASVKSERDENLDRLLRKAAEFDNYRKRTEREKLETFWQAKSAVLTEILPVVDGFERALESFSEAASNPDLAQYKEGVQLLYKQLKDALARLGVTVMDAQGKEFDPHLHEALVREETSGYPENTIIEVLQPGYFFKDRLLRPAKVKVAISPKDKEVKPSSKAS